MRCFYKNATILAGIIIIAMCVLPVMSADVLEMESCTLIVRGYNLMEFSAWGAVPLLAGFLIPAILSSRNTRPIQPLQMWFLLVGNMVCYVHSFNAARAWLEAVGNTLITYHAGMFLYPLAFIGTLVCGSLFAVKHTSRPVDYYIL